MLALVGLLASFVVPVQAYAGSGVVTQYRWTNDNCEGVDFSPHATFHFGVCAPVPEPDVDFWVIASYNANVITFSQFSDEKCSVATKNNTAPLFGCVKGGDGMHSKRVVPGPALVVRSDFRNADCSGTADSSTRFLSYACWNQPDGTSHRVDVSGPNVMHVAFASPECAGEGKADTNMFNDCFATPNGSAKYVLDF